MRAADIKKAVLALFVLLSTLTKAQKQCPARNGSYLSGGFGHFTFSGQKLDLTNLNQMLNSKGYNSINQNYTSFGGGGGFVIRNFFIGGEGGGFVSNRASSANSTIDFNAACGYFNLGYVIGVSKRSVLCPVVGIGGGGYTMDVRSKNVNSNFPDQLNSPNGSVSLGGGGLLLNSQICYQYFFGAYEKQGFFIGFKAGYRYCPGAWKMDLNGIQVSNAPNVNMNGAYVSIILGGGAL